MHAHSKISAMLLCALVAGSCASASAPSTGSPTASAPATTVPTPSAPSPTPTPTPIALPTFAQLSAASGDVVWVLVGGDRLFRSTDRGTTWDESAGVPGPNATVSFVSAREGWALTLASPATQCQAQSVQLWDTTDAARTWERVSSTGIADAKCKSDPSFVDASRGFMSAWDPNTAPVIYRTTDGARTWSASRPLPDPAGFMAEPGGGALRAGSVRGFGVRFLVAATGGNPFRQYVFRSDDAGASWTYLATTPDPFGVAFVTATRWLQLVAPGQSKETTDAGATWHAYGSDYGQAAPVAPQILFGDPLTGYATVRGSLQRTIDGGLHWTALRTPGT